MGLKASLLLLVLACIFSLSNSKEEPTMTDLTDGAVP